MSFNKFIVVLVFASFLPFQSCKNEPYDSTSLRCWINGERHVIRTASNNPLRRSYRNLSIINDSLNIDIQLIPESDNGDKILNIIISSYTGPGTYRLREGEFEGSVDGKPFIPEFDAEFSVVSYRDNENSTATLIGYFHMATESHRITNGRFHYNFSIR